ncbi:MAG: TIM44-like domain-containing protein [Holosporales bacterium]|jgi:predicted lipid-binding transport protein (Tim44 family)|nr:TIM44-like domain-containing protein [Holosporales bacterium]
MITIILAALSLLIFFSLFQKLGKTKNVSCLGLGLKSQISAQLARAAPVVARGKDPSHDEMLVRQKFPNFVIEDFLVEAESTFNTVFNAFAMADCDVLKAELSTPLYNGFVEQIQKRKDLNLKQEILIKHIRTTLNKVQMLVTKAKLFVSFEVSQMSAILNSENVSFDNPKKIYRNVLHSWIFERKYDSERWILVKTSRVEI